MFQSLLELQRERFSFDSRVLLHSSRKASTAVCLTKALVLFIIIRRFSFRFLRLNILINILLVSSTKLMRTSYSSDNFLLFASFTQVFLFINGSLQRSCYDGNEFCEFSWYSMTWRQHDIEARISDQSTSLFRAERFTEKGSHVLFKLLTLRFIEQPHDESREICVTWTVYVTSFIA